MDLRSIDLEVVDLCRTVAKFIRTESENFDRAHIEQKEDFNNLVSYVDKEAEKKLVSALQRIYRKPGLSQKKVQSNNQNQTNTIGSLIRLMEPLIFCTAYPCMPSASV